MGEFTGTPGPPENMPEPVQNTDNSGDTKMYDTDVDDIKAVDIVKQGTLEFPVFDCDKEEFFQNMQSGRKRLRFKNGSTVQQYMQRTKYNRPFYVRHTDEKGHTYTRKIK